MPASTTFYSGPASNVEIEANPSTFPGTQSDLGECADIVITWEPTTVETMEKKKVQTGGIGKFSAKGMNANSTVNTILEGTAGVRQDIRVTVNSLYYTVKNVLVRFGFSGELNDPNKTTVFDITGQVWTDDIDDFVTLPGV